MNQNKTCGGSAFDRYPDIAEGHCCLSQSAIEEAPDDGGGGGGGGGNHANLASPL